MNKEDVLTCRNHRMGTCERSEPVVLAEVKDYVQMVCRNCHGVWVVSTPDGKAKARYENRLNEIKRQEERRRERESRPVYFA